MGSNLGVTVLITVIKIIVTLYDIITIPFYYYVQKPWKKLELAQEPRAKQINPKDPYSPWVRVKKPAKCLIDECETISQMFDKIVAKHGPKKGFGYRPILDESVDVQANGRLFRKYMLADYKWYTFDEMHKKVTETASGFLQQGIKHNDIVMIMCDTRIEWMMSALALSKIGATVSTLYATLGEEGIIHGINETEVSHIITSQDQLSKLKNVLKQCPLIKNIIYFEGFNPELKEKFPDEIKVTPFSEVQKLGQRQPFPSQYPKSKSTDTAILMYTSGSTGIPKGVMISHQNLLSSAKSYYVIHYALGDETFLAYLPLAHVLELAAELFFMSRGAAIGYGSPFTMTDKSTGIQKGCRGDCTVLKPTILPAVPLVLDRLRKGIVEEIGMRGEFAKQLFQFFLNYKRHWTKQAYRTPIVNFLLCRKIKQIIGGRVKFAPVGGAPLGPETHEFVEACLDMEVLQGYGLTEIGAAGTLMDINEMSTGRVGAPLNGVYIKLVDWQEGNYRVTDKPHPRGEIVIGGGVTSKGYYRKDSLTEESYFDDNGVRWFYTGDIGEIYPNGTIKIIDRRKDLVKLQFGEYVSLGKVEAELKSSTYVDNICVIGDSFHDHLIALVVPNPKSLKTLAQNLGKEKLTFDQLCVDPQINNEITKDISNYSRTHGLHKMETPTRIKLCQEEWLPDSGLVTAALKVRRKNIHDYYKNEIRMMYEQDYNKSKSS